MKTLKDILVRDNLLSGPLTPENGKSYNPALGEPKYYTAYRINEIALLNMIREWIKFLEEEKIGDDIIIIAQKIFQVKLLKKIFNLEND